MLAVLKTLSQARNKNLTKTKVLLLLYISMFTKKKKTIGESL